MSLCRLILDKVRTSSFLARCVHAVARLSWKVLGNLHLLLLWERRQRADQKEKTHEKFRILQTEVL